MKNSKRRQSNFGCKTGRLGKVKTAVSAVLLVALMGTTVLGGIAWGGEPTDGDASGIIDEIDIIDTTGIGDEAANVIPLADPVASLSVGANFTTTNPASGAGFQMELQINSSAYGETGMIEDLMAEFDLPAYINLTTIPSSSKYTVTTTGTTHVKIEFNDDVAIGSSQSMLFGLAFAPGISVHDVNTWQPAITATSSTAATATYPDPAGSVIVNPANNALPDIMTVEFPDYDPSLLHTTVVKLKPEANIAGLNHNSAKVTIDLDDTAQVYSIIYNGVDYASSIITGSGRQTVDIPITGGVFAAGGSDQRIEINYKYPPAASAGTPEDHAVNITYSADRQNGIPVSELESHTETVVIAIDDATPSPAGNFVPKTANPTVFRKAGALQSYHIEVKPLIALKDLVVTDEPTGNEPDYYKVHHYTNVEWSALTPMPGLESSGQTWTRVSYKSTETGGDSWTVYNPTATASGSFTPGSLGVSQITDLKFEFFSSAGGTTIPAGAGGTMITLSAVTDAAITNNTSAENSTLDDAKLTNTLKVSGEQSRNGSANWIAFPASPNDEVLSNTAVTAPSTNAWLSAGGGAGPMVYWDKPSGGNYATVWSEAYGGVPVQTAIRIEDEVWVRERFSVSLTGDDNSAEPLKGLEMLFVVDSPFFDVVDVQYRNSVQGITYETVPYAGGTIVKVKVTRDPYPSMSWGEQFTWHSWGGSEIGIKLKALPGATTTSVWMTIGTENLEQLFTRGVFLNSGVSVDAGVTPPNTFHAFQTTYASVTVDNSLGLNPQNTAASDLAGPYASRAGVDNLTGDAFGYYHLRIENKTEGGYGSFERQRIIDMLPYPGDTMAITAQAKGSNVTPVVEAITDAAGAQIDSLTVKLYYSENATWATVRAELNDVQTAGAWSPSQSTWISWDGESPLPITAKAIKIEREESLAPDASFDAYLKVRLPQETDSIPDEAWNAFSAGANYGNNGDSNIIIGEPTKAGLIGGQTYSLRGIVWNDLNRDGTHAAAQAEPGIPGLGVNLFTTNDEFVASTTTGADGSYSFTGLFTGSYYVLVDPPGGFTLTTLHAGGDATTDCDFVLDPQSRVIAYRSITNNNIVNVDAGFYDPAGIIPSDPFALTAFKRAASGTLTRAFDFALWTATPAGVESGGTAYDGKQSTTGAATAFVNFKDFSAYTNAGVYDYIVKETTANGGGWTVDLHKYWVKVAVENVSGQYKVTSVKYIVSDNTGAFASVPVYPGGWISYALNTPGSNEELVFTNSNTGAITPKVSVEVDQDTIKRTAAAFESRADRHYYNNVADADNWYKYEIDFRSTSNVPVEEFVVDDQLEAVKLGQIRVEEMWTPITWGDADGKFYVLYKTSAQASNDVTPYTAASGNAAKADRLYSNDGYKLWAGIGFVPGDSAAGGLSATVRNQLKVSDLNLAPGEYVTAIRFDYGEVNVGFTSKNYADESINGENRNNVGELSLQSVEDAAKIDISSLSAEKVSPLKALFALDAGDGGVQIAPLATGISGNTVDWTPPTNPAAPNYSAELAQKTSDGMLTLKPAAYLVSATNPIRNANETIVTSVVARGARGTAANRISDEDQDAVVTQVLVTYVANPADPPDAASIVLQNSFLNHASDNGVVLRGGHWVDRNGNRVRVGRGGSAGTSDTMALGAWFAVMVAALVCLVLLWVINKVRRKRKEISAPAGMTAVSGDDSDPVLSDIEEGSERR